MSEDKRISSFNTRKEAMEAMLEYGQTLVAMEKHHEYGVYIQKYPLPHLPSRMWPWGLFLHQYNKETVS